MKMSKDKIYGKRNEINSAAMSIEEISNSGPWRASLINAIQTPEGSSNKKRTKVNKANKTQIHV